jgi:hypothetical protein
MNHMLVLGACWSGYVWRTAQQVRKNNKTHFEEKKRMWQDLRKSDANVDKPSLVRVRVWDVL